MMRDCNAFTSAPCVVYCLICGFPVILTFETEAWIYVQAQQVIRGTPDVIGAKNILFNNCVLIIIGNDWAQFYEK